MLVHVSSNYAQHHKSYLWSKEFSKLNLVKDKSIVNSGVVNTKNYTNTTIFSFASIKQKFINTENRNLYDLWIKVYQYNNEKATTQLSILYKSNICEGNKWIHVKGYNLNFIMIYPNFTTPFQEHTQLPYNVIKGFFVQTLGNILINKDIAAVKAPYKI